MKRIVVFDLDRTLADSKQAIDSEMGGLLARLTQIVMVAVISGGDWPQFTEQLVDRLPDSMNLSRLLLLPTSGTKLYRYDGHWQQVYAEAFTTTERDHVLLALDRAVGKLGFAADRSWGAKIQDRGSQITFSGLGQEAPLSAKLAWDPDFAKRRQFQAELAAVLPGFSINTGGSTSIDITRSGVDKAYGLRKLAEIAKISTAEMIFVGDAIYPGGNDYPVREAGISAIGVRDIDATKRVIEAIIACLA